MNKEAVRWLIETGLLDFILLKRLQVHLEKRGKKASMQKHCDFCRVSDLLSHPKLMKKHLYRNKHDY